MCRLSSLCAEKPNVMVARSPLKLAPLMNGTNSRLVSRYSKLNEMAVRNSNGPAAMASSANDLGTLRYQTPVVHLPEVVQAAVVLVVLADRVDLGLGVAQLVDALAEAANRAPGPSSWRARNAKCRCAAYSSGVTPWMNSFRELMYRASVSDRWPWPWAKLSMTA